MEQRELLAPHRIAKRWGRAAPILSPRLSGFECTMFGLDRSISRVLRAAPKIRHAAKILSATCQDRDLDPGVASGNVGRVRAASAASLGKIGVAATGEFLFGQLQRGSGNVARFAADPIASIMPNADRASETVRLSKGTLIKAPHESDSIATNKDSIASGGSYFVIHVHPFHVGCEIERSTSPARENRQIHRTTTTSRQRLWRWRCRPHPQSQSLARDTSSLACWYYRLLYSESQRPIPYSEKKSRKS